MLIINCHISHFLISYIILIYVIYQLSHTHIINIRQGYQISQHINNFMHQKVTFHFNFYDIKKSAYILYYMIYTRILTRSLS